MNVAQDAIPWSKRRWFWTVLGILAVHLALIWCLSEALPSRASKSVSVSVLRLLTPPGDPAKEWFELNDPALFALTSPKGFSGSAWLKMAPFPYRLTNRVEPAYWLGGRSIPLAENAGRLIETDRPHQFLRAEKPPPGLAVIRVPGSSSVIRASCRTEGDLAFRTLLSTDPLPDAEPETVLANFVITVTVNGAGDVISHVPISSSGSSSMDAKMTGFAKAARFAPLENPAALTIGNFVFEWTAVTLTETNSSAVKN